MYIDHTRKPIKEPSLVILKNLIGLLIITGILLAPMISEVFK